MRSIFALMLMFILSSIQAMAYVPNVDPVPGRWYAVYTCDNGAMVIDKGITGVSGSYKSYSTQVVIRNQEIIKWFFQNNAVYSQGTYNELIYGNLYPRFSNEYFHSDQYLTQEIKIDDSQEKISITVNVYGTGQANWIFRDCQRTEAFKLFQ